MCTSTSAASVDQQQMAGFQPCPGAADPVAGSILHRCSRPQCFLSVVKKRCERFALHQKTSILASWPVGSWGVGKPGQLGKPGLHGETRARVYNVELARSADEALPSFDRGLRDSRHLYSVPLLDHPRLMNNATDAAETSSRNCGVGQE